MLIIDDLATGGPTRTERTVAGGVALAVLLILAVVLPVAGTRLSPIPAFVPLAGTFLALLQLLTALVFFNQYAVSRSRRLAVLGATFLFQSIISFAYVLEFPGIFGRAGFFSQSIEASSYLYNAGNCSIALFALLYVVAARSDAKARSSPPRGFGTAFACGSALIAFGFWFIVSRFGGSLPRLIEGNVFTPLLSDYVSPGIYSVTLVALVAVLVYRRFGSVTDLWLAVVLLAKFAQELLTGPLGNGRYTAGWYFGRFEAIVAAVLILGAFLIRLNALTLVLAARTRSLSRRTEDDAVALAASEQRYRALAESLPQLVFTLGADGELEYANERLLVYTGVTLAAAVQTGLDQLIDERDREQTERQIRLAIAAGTGFDVEYRLRSAVDGTSRWFLCRASIARDLAGVPVRWFGTMTEIEAQKRAEEREAFLGYATESFGISLDLTATLVAIARTAVPVLGTFARSEFFGDEIRTGELAFSAADDESERLVAERLADPDRGMPTLLDRLAQGEHAIVLDPLAPASGRAVVVFPLLSREEVVGTIALVVGPEFGERAGEARLGRSYARRAAIALERARLYQRERRIADTLQRAMLPTDLPKRNDLTFSAAYSAASESELVGGDFYDAFVVPDGRIAVLIGDVAGHGLDAAVTMGEVRQSMRASAFETTSPSQVLDRAGRLFTAGGRSGMVTAVFALFDPATRKLTFACAGHPAPLLRVGTRVERLEGSGLPLGLRDGLVFDVTADVPPGAAVAFFTDGLIEFDRDVVGGEQLVEDVFAVCGDLAANDAAAGLRDRVLAGRAPADDVAVLVFTLAGPTPAEEPAVVTRAWRFHVHDRYGASTARRAFLRFAEASLAPERVDDAILVYGELVANVVQHAPGFVTIAATRDANAGFSIVVEDAGPGFRYVPQTATPDAEHGRGWAIIAQLARELSVEPLERGSRASVVLA